jgi:hypothetical protein
MSVRFGILLTMALALTACNTHVHEPWVQFPDYQKQERSRSPELDQQLAQRVEHQVDR